MKNIYIIGSLNMDIVINSPYVPHKGETLLGSDFMTNTGGKGANQAVACGKLDGNIFMSGCVGNDTFGKEMINNLHGYGVNIDNVRVVDKCPSGVAVILIVEGDNRIILDVGANAKVSKTDVDRLLENSTPGDIFMTQLEIPIDIVGYALEQAKNKGLYTLLNPAPANKDCLKHIEYVDLLIPNESELRLLSGIDDIEEGCGNLLEKGLKEIVVTLGDKGYLYRSKEDSFKGECRKVKVIDTTAAGDTFLGALCVELTKDVELKEALQFASLAASLSVTKKGAQQSIPTKKEVLQFRYE